MNRFEGKVVVVTGGASGIGAAIAKEFHREGAIVIVADLKPGRGATDESADLRFIEHDVASDASWARLMEASQAQGPLDVLINCAGVMTPADIENTPLELFEQIMSINSTGTYLGCKHALVAMRAHCSGASIVNIASTTAIKPDTSVMAYSASKAAVVSITRTTALHCARSGYPIRCNAVLPGVVMTPMLQKLIDLSPDPEAAIKGLSAINPIGRLLDPTEVASVVLFAASSAASGMTGSAIVVDGGLTAG